MRSTLTFTLLTALALPIHAIAHQQQSMLKNDLFRHLAEDVMLPLTGDFARAAERLASASQSFCEGKSDLNGAQMAWRKAESAWQPLEMLQIGPVIERRTQRQINSWPVRPKLLARLLDERGPIESSEVDAVGAAGKGLPAMEYLLFSEDAARSKTMAPQECNALQALSAHVKSEAQGLAADWREPNGGYARRLAEAGRHPEEGDFASADHALSDIVNLLIAGIDAVKVRKLGKPLEKSEDGAALERIESWRSGSSLEHVRDNLRGFEMAFFGAGDADIGLDDFLASIERPGLARVIRQELDAARQALEAVRPPLQQALEGQRKQVEALHKALSRLQHLMETEVADALKVDLGFNANDGD